MTQVLTPFKKVGAAQEGDGGRGEGGKRKKSMKQARLF